VFCSMKTFSTTKSSPATQMPNQAAPVRVRGVRLASDVAGRVELGGGPAGPGCGPSVGGSAGALRV
jgi:hypothetical protein